MPVAQHRIGGGRTARDVERVGRPAVGEHQGRADHGCRCVSHIGDASEVNVLVGAVEVVDGVGEGPAGRRRIRRIDLQHRRASRWLDERHNAAAERAGGRQLDRAALDRHLAGERRAIAAEQKVATAGLDD